METKKVYQCFECVDGMQIFDTEEALITHKWDMIKKTKRKSHMCCHICKLDHRTFEGLVRHYQLSHPVKQKLNCPGCRAAFARLYQLMHHLDSDECPHILASHVGKQRILQVQATNKQAAALAAGIAAGGSVRDAPIGPGSGPGLGYTTLGAGLSGTAIHSAAIPGASSHCGVPNGTEAADDLVNRSEQLGIFDVSGVTIGDFGRFVGIDPAMAAAVAADEAATNSNGSQYRRLLETTAAAVHDNGGGSLWSTQRRIAPTSAEAAAQMIRRQRLMGIGGMPLPGRNMTTKNNNVKEQLDGGSGGSNSNDLHDILGNKTRPAASASTAEDTMQTVRDFRQGDAKGPDLLTEDLSPISRRFRGLDVWAGQDMIDADQQSIHGGSNVRGNASVSASAPGTKTSTAVPSLASGDGDEARNKTPGGSSGSAGVSIQGHGPRFRSILSIDHPDHPRFNSFKYRNELTGRFTCPHDMCRRTGKQYKSAHALMAHLRSETAHSTLRVQCPSCFSFFSSVNSLMQHCESQSSRCQFRESEDYLPFLNILTAGVAEVQGRNIDMTLSYSVQPTASKMLLQDGVYQGDDHHSQDDHENHDNLDDHDNHSEIESSVW